MASNYHPSIDTNVIETFLSQSGKVDMTSRTPIGDSIFYVTIGNQAIHKRMVNIRELEKGQVHFERAMALAYRFNFLTKLLKWYEENRGWKEGEYVE